MAVRQRGTDVRHLEKVISLCVLVSFNVILVVNAALNGLWGIEAGMDFYIPWTGTVNVREAILPGAW